tara:strand:- start:1260 stop:1691 length:432 start_codon:yes stop_codon:yes gene_type:complete
MDKPLQLMQLARVFPDKLVSKLKKKTHTEDYINHSVITQRLLQVCGPFDWDVEVIFNGEGKPVAAKGTLIVNVDGKQVKVSGIGTDQNNAGKDDGDIIKEMESDALKRAAMRVGVGLHLWAQDQYFLFAQMLKVHEMTAEDVG